MGNAGWLIYSVALVAFGFVLGAWVMRSEMLIAIADADANGVDEDGDRVWSIR